MVLVGTDGGRVAKHIYIYTSCGDVGKALKIYIYIYVP